MAKTTRAVIALGRQGRPRNRLYTLGSDTEIGHGEVGTNPRPWTENRETGQPLTIARLGANVKLVTCMAVVF